MVYEIVMPQLSDSMDEGKLVAWKKHVGDRVKNGDVIAEVESDKAIMELQSFKDGIITQELIDEEESVSVGSVIARIDTEGKIKEEPKEQVKQEEKKELLKETASLPIPSSPTPSKNPRIHASGISPKAKAKLAAYNIDVHSLQKSETILHENDVEQFIDEHFFTPKAQKLLREYNLQKDAFTLTHKIDAYEVLEYIRTNNIQKLQPLSSMQQAIIANVNASAKKPIYHVYEHLNADYFLTHQEHSITTHLVKIFAEVMMRHEAFRTKLSDNMLQTSNGAHIAIAVADAKNLYMPVIHNAQKLSLEQIDAKIHDFIRTLKKNSFSAKDMQGSNFAISNLGMFGIERFDAMLNKDDAAIAAIGGINEGEISVTLTLDHRLINGYEAALFVQDFKKISKNMLR